ncbi:glycoside hydrolase family 30 protein [Anaeromicropila herbilytica]|uniref:Glycosyl hydrolase n=1 Tax=Anaeromicropila herbilytica TaxID=2785025 RepID=A0A7R7EKN6_9FIRM|nr:glycoside hydrolase family 30 beta sandwich domain-containing protein [Anaeromicropila herbilytica]BCN30641.1 glycosyl hydrolase [Anaeromicropila herbilytica]
MRLEYISTIFLDNKKHVESNTIEFKKDDGIENNVINLYPDMKYQQFEGFGGALTDSSGYVYSLMGEDEKKKMLDTYFTKEQMNYSIARIHIDSCDFSLEHYEAMSDCMDRNMESFSLSRSEKYIFPLLEDAQKVLGKPLEVMISPWSPPAFMKTNEQRNHGGKLKEEYKEFWADYICKYIKELANIGYKITRMSLQNEPNATQTWDSCVYSPKEEKEFLRDYMYPALVRHGLSNIEIFIWDHNKERVYERANEIIDEETNHMVAGIAFHWYSGDHFEGLSLIKEKYPDKKLILSEACIEYYKFNKEDYLANAEKYAHDIIGNLNHGMNAFYDWNILLDEKGGPNHVHNYCDAPFLYDTKKMKLIEQNTLAYLYHFSHYILPGAVRIAYTKYTDQLEVTAFKNTNQSIVVVILNRTLHSMQSVIRLNGEYADITMEPQSISTCEINL